MRETSNGQDKVRPGLGIDWARPTVWMRLLLISLLIGLTFGAMPPVVGLMVIHWTEWDGDTLQYTTLLASAAILIGIATAVLQRILQNKGVAQPFLVLSQATWSEVGIAFVWTIAVAILAGLTGKMVLRLTAPELDAIGQSLILLGPMIVCMSQMLISDVIIVWLRRAGSAPTAS